MRTSRILDLAAALERHVQVLAGDIGERNVFRPDALHAAADYISQQWAGRGCVATRQNYQVQGVSCANIEVALAGSVHTDEIIVLGAHYDTVRNSPGADDNASGVAALLEIAGMLGAFPPRYTVRCVAFVNEEAPFFFRRDMGSEGSTAARGPHPPDAFTRDAGLLSRRTGHSNVSASAAPLLSRVWQLYRFRFQSSLGASAAMACRRVPGFIRFSARGGGASMVGARRRVE